MEVEVDGRPEDVSNPCAIVLLWLEKPLGIFEQDHCAERGAVYRVCVSSVREGFRSIDDIPAAGEPTR